MKNNQKKIFVYADWCKNEPAKLIGTLSVSPIRGKEIFSFEYSAEWLNDKFGTILDPDLQFFPGNQYLTDSKSNFGMFLDSSPDRWGRMLMRRREAVLARQENRLENQLYESDYLLGVFDKQRVGAMRFKNSETGPYLNDDEQLAIPPWSSLRTLEHASLEIENNNAVDDSEYIKWLNMLIAPGSSLGGARPKSGILDNENNLWIAKFPSRNDDKNVGAWEKIVNELAEEANIIVAESKVIKLSNKHHTFLSKRFDRDNYGNRAHFSSAMTMLGYYDGANEQIGVSYLEIVEFLMENGVNVDNNLEELWRRIVFSICVSNSDDHLRNHGFILTEKGWTLAPAYDINPVEFATGLSLNISENDNSLDLELAKKVAGYFRISEKKADKIIAEVVSVVNEWQKYADKYGVSKAEQEKMKTAFNNRQR